MSNSFYGLGVRAVCVSLAWAMSVPSFAVDWPQWRGPQRDGSSQEKGLLDAWPEGGPTLLFKAEGLGSAYASVAVVGDSIYTMGDKDDASMVIALHRKTGKLLWSTAVGKGGAPGWGGFAGPRCTPTVDGSQLFVVGQYGEIVALDARSGKEQWRKSMKDDLEGALPEWGFTESPLVDGARVVVTPGGPRGTLAALDRKTGKTLWRSKEWTDGAHYSSIIKAKICGVDQYVQLTAASVAGVDPTTGKLLWRADRPGATAVIPTPIVSHDMVYVSSGYGTGCNMFQVTKEGAEFKAEQVYANKLMTNHHGGVILVGDKLYGYSDGKGWVCQDLKTGETVWSEKNELGKGSIALADGHFYLREEDGAGSVALIQATTDGYKETGRFDPPNRSEKNSWAHPVVVGGRLYLRDQDVLLVYDVTASVKKK